MAYLDWNVICALQKGEAPAGARSQLVRLRESAGFLFPWSSAHLHETRNLRLAVRTDADEVIADVLGILNEVSGGHFWHYRRAMFTRGRAVFVEGVKDPRLLEARYQGPGGGGVEEVIATAFPDDLGRAVRQATNLDPQTLNNLGPAELTVKLREGFKAVLGNQDAAARGAHLMLRRHPLRTAWMSFLSLFIAFPKPPSSWDELIISLNGPDDPGTPPVYARMNDLLDTLGYFPDKRREETHTGVARVWDGHHACYAARANFFVTDDKRLAKRAAVVYHWTGVTTRIVTLREFLALPEVASRGERG